MVMITPGPVDSVLDPEPHHPPAGDWHDDDGRAIDDYLNTSDPGPGRYVLVPMPKEELPSPNRILRTRLVLTAPNQGGSPQAVRAFPADLKRTKVKITELTNKGFYFHSESFAILDTPLVTTTVAQTMAYFSSGTGSPGIPTGPVLELDNYTGPIYVAPPMDGPVALEILCVTS